MYSPYNVNSIQVKMDAQLIFELEEDTRNVFKCTKNAIGAKDIMFVDRAALNEFLHSKVKTLVFDKPVAGDIIKQPKRRVIAKNWI